jgi:hypothetical protein
MNYLKKKIIKKPEYFIIKFPNGAEALIKVNGWQGCNAYAKYIKDEYDANTVLVSISKWEAFKFFLKGELFNVNK